MLELSLKLPLYNLNNQNLISALKEEVASRVTVIRFEMMR